MKRKAEFARQVVNLIVAGCSESVLSASFLAQLLALLPDPEGEVAEGMVPFLITIPKKVVPLAHQFKMAGMKHHQCESQEGTFKIDPLLDLRSEISVSDMTTPIAPYLALGVQGHDAEPLQLTWSDLGDYDRFFDNEKRATCYLRLEEAIALKLHFPAAMPKVRMCLFGSWLAHPHVFTTSWLCTFVMPGKKPEARWYLDENEITEPFPVVLPWCETRLIPKVCNPPWDVIPTRTPMATMQGATFVPGTPMVEEERSGSEQTNKEGLDMLIAFIDEQVNYTEEAGKTDYYRAEIQSIVVDEAVAFIAREAKSGKLAARCSEEEVKRLNEAALGWRKRLPDLSVWK